MKDINHCGKSCTKKLGITELQSTVREGLRVKVCMEFPVFCKRVKAFRAWTEFILPSYGACMNHLKLSDTSILYSKFCLFSKTAEACRNC